MTSSSFAMGDYEELSALLQAYALKHGAVGPVPSAETRAAPPSRAASVNDEDERFALLRSVGEECQTEAELRNLLKRGSFNLYDGFEPSGRMHIAQGIFKAVNVNKCTKAGGFFIFWVADWFALMNDKMGGDLEKIKTVGKYLIEVWKAAGMDMTRVKFLWSSDEINKHARDYWLQALDVARRTNMARAKKCCQIMGRKEDGLSAAQILYPIMQCTDIFFLKADICQLGVDQRKVNMLAREYCDQAQRKEKPVILSHHMLYGLKAGQAKMSKSDPDSAIFMEDKVEDVVRKITNAYCPTKPKESEAVVHDDEMHLVKDDVMNPCLDYLKNILFSQPGYVFQVGGVTYTRFEDAKDDFLSGKISEDALKKKLIDEINTLLDPVRRHFETNQEAKEMLAKITEWKKETMTAPPSAARLQVINASAGPVFAVFAPLPSDTLKLEDVFGVVSRLRRAPAESQLILWLEDWTAYALNRVGGSIPCIKAFYDLLVGALKALAPELMGRVRICRQEEMILSNPSDYWISVINTGRRSTVETITKYLPEGHEMRDASQVFAALMHAADVFALSGDAPVTLCCDTYHKNLHEFAKEQCEKFNFTVPNVLVPEERSLRLQPPGDGVEADKHIFVTDKDLDVNRKIKKSFCEIGNIQFCPALSWISELLEYKKEIAVTRKPENGGDKAYTDASAMQDDFSSGALHPNDMKPAVSRTVNAVMEGLREALKSCNEMKAAQKALEAHVKAAQKKK
eukprot:TRINITY_DN2009_c0_g1_i1.p1 TRINITY_DN2009_c0_g1~~TRINITY_DN2009_c0_g1_i1.p1  ORF type:complete len:741 (+),score=177.25 TRINITY_DN2009_c0_g1_i1:66-2288(+)